MQSTDLIQSFMQSVLGILTFDTLISPAILMLCYYMGAVILPVIIYRYVYRHFKNISPVTLPEVEIAAGKTSFKFSARWIFILSFIAFEIFWRIFFEFIIAYFQIRDALMSINAIG